MPLAPEYQAMLAELAKQEAPPITALPPEQARELYRLMRPADGAIEIGSVRSARLPEPTSQVELRIYQAAGDEPRGTIVNFHGGGWVIGDLDTADTVCRLLCRDTGCTVVSVDYRLAPEHPFPAAVEDAWAATLWVADNLDELNGNGRIAVTGESAGANLAAVVAQKARDAGEPAIALQVLYYPVVDADMTRASYTENGEGYVLETATMAWFWEHYCPPGERTDPAASPLLATNLGGVAPACVVTAEFDPLRDEGQAYAEALGAAGVAVEYLCAEGLVHDFMAMAHAFPSCQAASEAPTEAFKRALS